MRAGVLAYAAVAGGANVLGAVAVTSRRRWSTAALDVMVAVAAGFMIAVALLEMVPESVARGGPSAAVVVLAGFLLVHLTQHTLAAHFHFGEERHVVATSVGGSALLGLLLHTLVDGVAIASAFAVSQPLGLLVFFAVLLHKAPEGVAIASLFLAAGRRRRSALLAATALGVATVCGAAGAAAVAGGAARGLALAAGVTLYVAASNLIPEFQSRRQWRLQLAFFAGCALFVGARAALSGA